MKEISAINDLVLAFENYKLKNTVNKKSKENDYSKHINAINQIISSCKTSKFSYTKNIKQNPKTLVAINEIVSLLLPKIKFNPKPSFLKQINRSKDENLHSDFINALIKDSRITDKILAKLEINGRLISSKRECRLDNIDKKLKNTELGARRIDIYIETDMEIVILENKQYTIESLNQTTDYYNVVSGNNTKHVKGILLAPSKLEPQCKKFKPMSYYELFFILESVFLEHPTELMEQYLSELFELFIKPYQQNTGEHNGN